MGHVLLLHHADLGVQPPAPVGGVKIADVHIIVHRLLLRRRDDVHMQLGHQRGLFALDGLFDRVRRPAVVGDGGPGGHDLGVPAHQLLGMDAPVHLQQVGVAVQVVKVLQKGKVQRLLDLPVRLALGHAGGQVHGQLLVADGVLQQCLVQRFQRGDVLLLLLFLPAQQGQLPPQIVVLAVAVELVAEPNRLELGAVHQDAAHAGVGVGLPLVIGAGGHGFPVHKALVQRAGSLVKGIH